MTIPNPPASRHLLRALLRASTYLPDASARQYISSHILHRFRNKPVPSPTDPHKARQTLNLLSRACHGDIPALTKVLQYTYGRAGKRRRELISWMLNKHSAESATPTDPETDPPAPAPIPANIRSIIKPPGTVPTFGGIQVPAKPHTDPITSFEKLVADQVVHRPPATRRGALKTVYPPIPAESAWGRPLAIRREAGMRTRWKADVLDKILPALPAVEWDRLRDLATGVLAPEGAMEKRTKVGVGKSQEGSLLTAEYLKTPITHAHAKVKDAEILSRGRHELTPKFMKRLYAELWSLSPKMEWDLEKRDWVYTWGGSRSAASRGEVGRLVQRDLQLFEGIERLEEKKEKKGKKGKKPIFRYQKDYDGEGKSEAET